MFKIYATTAALEEEGTPLVACITLGEAETCAKRMHELVGKPPVILFELEPLT